MTDFAENVAESIKVINDLFENMMGLFPSSYTFIKCQDDLDNIKVQWYRAFKQKGLINNERAIDKVKLAKGMSALLDWQQPFMPSCPQFIEHCLHDTDDFDLF
jgi:hypothetical protein